MNNGFQMMSDLSLGTNMNSNEVIISKYNEQFSIITQMNEGNGDKQMQ